MNASQTSNIKHDWRFLNEVAEHWIRGDQGSWEVRQRILSIARKIEQIHKEDQEVERESLIRRGLI